MEENARALACLVLEWMIFLEPTESEFLHESQEDIVFCRHEVSPIVKAKIVLYCVYVSLLFDSVDTSSGELFPMNLFADFEDRLKSFFGDFKLLTVVAILPVEGIYELFILHFMIPFRMNDSIGTKFLSGLRFNFGVSHTDQDDWKHAFWQFEHVSNISEQSDDRADINRAQPH